MQISAEIPETLTACNCSLCSCYAGLLAYFPSRDIKELAFVRCSKCGCFSHWENLKPEHVNRIGVNARLFRNIDITNIRVRHFDGAGTREFLD